MMGMNSAVENGRKRKLFFDGVIINSVASFFPSREIWEKLQDYSQNLGTIDGILWKLQTASCLCVFLKRY